MFKRLTWFSQLSQILQFYRETNLNKFYILYFNLKMVKKYFYQSIAFPSISIVDYYLSKWKLTMEKFLKTVLKKTAIT